ncbi:regucalcin-like [Cylas formicarius]|uniref:regucalcin-like n=1 Tax=Cylas formicarius TaxID=197179 RepID=UPI002958B3C9|nr:regucalcin-like [Cylas formicarius]
MELLFYFVLALGALFVSGEQNKAIVEITPVINVTESIFVDDEHKVIYYVDALGNSVYKHAYERGETSSIEIPAKTVGAAIPIEGKHNEFIVAAHHEILRVHWSEEDTAERVTKLHTNLKLASNERFFQGKADAKGRLWISTFRVGKGGPADVIRGGGTFYSITVHKNHSTTIEKKLSNVNVVTGLGWTQDGRHMYYVDAYKRKVFKYNFDLNNGDLGHSKVLFDLDHHPHLHGDIHGLAVKYNGAVVVSLWNGGALVLIDGHDGSIIEKVTLPIQVPTSLAWGKGLGRNVVLVGSSRIPLTEEEIIQNPFDSGSVYLLNRVNCTGVPSFKIRLAD